MKKKWMVLPLVLLAIAGLLITGCGDGNNNNNGANGTIEDITLKVMNGNAQEAETPPVQLPPGARVVVNAIVTVDGKANTAFTVNVNIPNALTGKIIVTDANMDGYAGAKQIQVAADATVNMSAREWITVTVASAGDTTKKAEWKFFVWGNAVTPAASFDVRNPQLSKLPNLTVPDEDKYEDSVPMSARFRITGYPVQVFRADTGKSAFENEADQKNGMGYISGEDLEMLQNAVPGSLVRLYFSATRWLVNDAGDGVEEDPPGQYGRNNWGVLKFGNDNLELKAPNGNDTFYIDAELDDALEAMAANQKDEIFVNVYNSILLKMELWEPLRPVTWTNKGNLITAQTTGNGSTITLAGTSDAHALLRAAKEDSYLVITMESPEVRPGWTIAYISPSGNNAGIAIPDNPTVLESGWVRFTVNKDLWTIYRDNNYTTPLSNTQDITFRVWNIGTGSTESELSGTPRWVSVELFAIDD